MKKSHWTMLAVVAVIGIALAATLLVVPEAHSLIYAAADPGHAVLLTLAAGATVAVPKVSSKKIRGLTAQKAEVLKQMRAISDAAGDSALSAEAQTQFDALKAKRDALDASIAREAELIAEEASLGVLEVPDAARISVEERRDADGKGGFQSFGHFSQAVLMGSRKTGASIDQRLVYGDHDDQGNFRAAAPTTYGNELSGVDGGFLIPPQFASDIFTLALGEDSLLPYCDVVDLDAGNSMVFPKDETTPWGTDGIRMYWQAEAGSGTQTKPKLGTLSLRLHKLLGLVPMSDELVADARALNGYLPKKLGNSLRWKLNEAIINGTGAGQPEGVVSSAAVVTVSKDSGQATLTLSALNVANMRSQLPNPASYGGAIWLIHPTAMGALLTLNNSGFPYFMPWSGPRGVVQQAPNDMLWGRPIVYSQHAAAFTSLGDVQLHDLSYYQVITKGGPQMATSLHLYFDADATAFRLTYRVDGKPKISTSITQAKGSTKLSPFLQLQAR